ncbi:MAG: GxxExxY protein [Saprospiraceae bacterium]|nr:GxxExxY protein [Saprospiraceae bacterium]
MHDEHKIIIELKAVDAINSIHNAQIMTYLRLYKLNWDCCSI